jgi:hypothetical protein
MVIVYILHNLKIKIKTEKLRARFWKFSRYKLMQLMITYSMYSKGKYNYLKKRMLLTLYCIMN